MKILKKLLAILIIITLINLFPIIINLSKVEAADTVSLSLVPQPYIDVVLSKSKTNTNLLNFKQDLLNAHKLQGVDTSKVNISAIEAQSVNIQSAFQWNQDVSSSIGSIQIVNGGQNVTMQGNPRKAGKNAIWIIPPKDVEQTFNFGYNIVYGDSFNAAGMLLRVQRNGNTLTGYMLSFNNYSWKSSANNANAAIWEFSYGIGQNSTNMTKTLKKTLSISQSGTLTVKATSSEIQVSGGGLSGTQVYELEKPMGSGFGFFSDHYSHNCERIGSFTLTGINLKTESVKKIEEVLREPDWRESSIKVLVNVNDVVNEQLNNPNSLGELLTRMINDEIHYAAWGKNVNEAQSRNFIAANNNNGVFINNTNYANSITKTAQYIKSLIESMKSSEYVILNENTILSAADPSIMTNTAGGDFPYGRWKVLHDCEYYENNIGQFAKSGKYISDMITSFSKTGKYEIYYENREVQPTTIYVHRKPVAEIDVIRNGNNVELISLGYDLDCYSNNRGVKEEEWKWRKVGETIWHDGKLTDITNGTDYLVQLRVKDFQDTWSVPVSKYITKNNVLPIASFKIKNQNTSIYEQVEVVDGSYDPYGGTITSRRWTIYKGNTKIYQGATPLANYKSHGIGSYKMSLEVTNNRGMTSEIFSRNFTIIPDDEAPEFTALPISCDWQPSITINITFKDRLGSGFKEYKYAITDSQEEPTTWDGTRTNGVDNITINQDGIKYLHIVATDNAGNISEDRVVGPYKIDKTPPVARVTHEPVDWVIDYVTIKWRFTDAQSGIDYIILPDGTRTTTIGGDYIVSENGNYTFKAYDKTGNEKIYTETITNIDKTAPRGIVSLNNSDLTDHPIKIKWEALDNESGFDKIILPDSSISKEPIGEFPVAQMGDYTFIIYDKAGNDKTISIRANNIDMEKPSLIITQKEMKWTNEDISLYWEAHDSQSGIKEVVLPDSTITVKETGEHIVTQNGVYSFIAYDKIGNGILVKHEVSNIDKTAPFLKLKTEHDENDNVVILWEMEDSQSGIRNIVLPNGQMSNEKTGSFVAKQNGTYTFIAYDKVGNDTVMKIKVDNLDKEGIHFSLSKEKVDDTYYRIIWEIPENQEDFKHILLPNNTYSTEYQGYFIVAKPGDYTFLAYDEAGNETKQTITIMEKSN